MSETEIYRANLPSSMGTGTEQTVIWAGLSDDGHLTVTGQDMGPSVERMWGDSDYEYGIRIKPEDIPTLWPHLLRALFDREQVMTVGRLKTLCEEAGVNPQFWSWT